MRRSQWLRLLAYVGIAAAVFLIVRHDEHHFERSQRMQTSSIAHSAYVACVTRGNALRRQVNADSAILKYALLTAAKGWAAKGRPVTAAKLRHQASMLHRLKIPNCHVVVYAPSSATT